MDTCGTMRVCVYTLSSAQQRSTRTLKLMLLMWGTYMLKRESLYVSAVCMYLCGKVRIAESQRK